jgi:anthranilate phosphoribosyltransferase
MTELTTEQAVALAVAGGKLAKAKKELAPGTHEVTVMAEITVTLTKGEDYDQNIVPKADAWGLLAAALRGKDSREIAAIVRESLSGDLKGEIDRLKGAAAAAIMVLKGATLTRCAGKVTHSGLTVSLVEATEAVPA